MDKIKLSKELEDLLKEAPFYVKVWDWFSYRIKQTYQIWTKGYTCTDLMDLDLYLAPRYLRMLKEFKETSISVPPTMKPEEWDAILDEIIFAFNFIVSDYADWTMEEEDRATKGFELFGKHYQALWK